MSLQRCEGTNLESVLEEVRARFGNTATIVEANRLRKGGVGGFFARERFEVVVDIDEDDPFAALPTEVPAEYGVEATEDFCERLLSMADDVSDRDEPARPGPATPSVSTEQPEFAAILGSITRHMDGPTLPPPRQSTLGRWPGSVSRKTFAAGPLRAQGHCPVPTLRTGSPVCSMACRWRRRCRRAEAP